MSGTPQFPARYPLIDITRGLAALMVVAFHSVSPLVPLGADTPWGTVSWPLWLLSRGAFGVTLFFVISGYCISVTTHATVRRGDSVWTFAARRFRRIYPPFWASIALVAALAAILTAIGRQDLWQVESITTPLVMRPFELATNLTLTHTWLPGVLQTGVRTVNGVSWSLCYEEQFYLVCGVAAAMAMGIRRSALFPLLVIVTAAVVGLVAYTNGGELIRGTFLGPKWLQFALGGLVYYRLAVATGRTAVIADGVLFGSVGVLTLLQVVSGLSFQWQNQFAQLWVAALFAVALRFIRPFDDRLRSALVRGFLWEPLHRLGQMTYSLYLVHAPIVMIVTAWAVEQGLRESRTWLLVVVPVATVTSLAGSWLFYELIERRCLNRPLTRSGSPEAVTRGLPQATI